MERCFFGKPALMALGPPAQGICFHPKLRLVYLLEQGSFVVRAYCLISGEERCSTDLRHYLDHGSTIGFFMNVACDRLLICTHSRIHCFSVSSDGCVARDPAATHSFLHPPLFAAYHHLEDRLVFVSVGPPLFGGSFMMYFLDYATQDTATFLIDKGLVATRMAVDERDGLIYLTNGSAYRLQLRLVGGVRGELQKVPQHSPYLRCDTGTYPRRLLVSLSDGWLLYNSFGFGNPTEPDSEQTLLLQSPDSLGIVPIFARSISALAFDPPSGTIAVSGEETTWLVRPNSVIPRTFAWTPRSHVDAHPAMQEVVLLVTMIRSLGGESWAALLPNEMLFEIFSFL